MERRHDWVLVASVRGERARPYYGGRSDRPVAMEDSSLAQAMRIASQIAPPSHITPVVLDEHRPWWAPLLGDVVPKQNMIVEPFDRGTAAGIMLAAVRLLRRDPKAHAAILSMDVQLDDVDSVYRCALDLAKTHDTCAGITRDGRIDRLEWLPARDVEMIVGSVQHLVALFQSAQPKLLQTYMVELRGPALFSDDALDSLYPFLPEVAFTTGVLEELVPTAISAPLAEARTAAVS